MRIQAKDLIMPCFATEGEARKEKIKTFPGVFRFSIDKLAKEVEELMKVGICSVLLFGVTEEKDESGSYAFEEDGVVQKAVRALKTEFPGLRIITDVCLCAYTTHGHCGILKVHSSQSIVHSQRMGSAGLGDNVKIDVKKTLETLARIALSHARAGADVVAPSAMAKGQVGAIRKALNAAGFENVKIMGYSAKFASSFYGPFRNATDCAPRFGDRSGYQLDWTAPPERALSEIRDDIEEGADFVMVKPSLAYLDVIRAAKEKFNHPLAAYNTSGEYSLIKDGARLGILKERPAVYEVLSAIKRAGADLIITYHAKDVASWLRNS